MGPGGEVIQVVAVGVGLAFERDVVICLVPVAVLNEPARPFNEVEYIERHEQQLTLLGSVDAFVVDDIAVNPTRVSRPKRSEKVKANALRHQPTFYYHRKDVTLTFLNSIFLSGGNQPFF